MNFSCVYSFQCKDKSITDLYIGSCKDLYYREATHKSNCINKKARDYNIPLYQFIRQNGGLDNWDMIVEVKTDDLIKEDREILEQCYIDLLEPTLNSKNAYGWDMERKKNYNSKKANCPHCNLEMRKDSIRRHLRKSCKA